MIAKQRQANRTSNDPISDFLTRVRNALLIHKETVSIPYSKLKEHLAETLKQEGYITSFKLTEEDSVKTKSIEVELKYTAEGKSVITGLKRISKPGLRKYTKAKEAPRVYNGLGVSILSTNKGLKTDRGARKEKLGGEVLCEIW